MMLLVTVILDKNESSVEAISAFFCTVCETRIKEHQLFKPEQSAGHVPATPIKPSSFVNDQTLKQLVKALTERRPLMLKLGFQS